MWEPSTKYCGISPSFTFVFFVKKSTVNDFCSRAQPLYFSLDRMLWIVDTGHFSLPPGVGMPKAVRRTAMPFGVRPYRNRR